MLLIGEARQDERAALPPWRAVWPLAIAETISWGILYYTFSVLLVPMMHRVRASETTVSAALSVALLTAGFISPLVGRAVDRRGPGAVMMFGSLVGAAGFAMLGSARTPVELYVIWSVLGVAHACTSYEPAFTAITGWFADVTERRRALLVLTSCAGFASTLFVPLAAWLVPTVGFRPTTLVFAAVLGVVVTSLHFVVGLAARPQCVAPHVDDVARATDARSLRTITLVTSIHAFASMGATAFLFPSLVARDVAAPQAAWLSGLVGASQVPARLLYEPFCRAVPSRARFALLLAIQAMAIVGWATLGGAPRIASLVAFGGANGLATLERASVIGEWFGAHGYGARSGVVAAGSAFARSAAPLVVASIASRTSYPHAFVVLAAALVGATVLQVLAERARSRV